MRTDFLACILTPQWGGALRRLEGRPHAATPATRTHAARVHPYPCMARGPCTDHTRARANKELQPKPATAEDATHVHAHEHPSRVQHPGTRARPPTIDRHTFAQRHAQLALPHVSTRNGAPRCTRRSAAAAAASSPSSSPRTCRRPPSPSVTPPRAGPPHARPPAARRSASAAAREAQHPSVRRAMNVGLHNAQTSRAPRSHLPRFPTPSGRTSSKKKQHSDTGVIRAGISSCDPGDGRRPPSHKSHRSHRSYRS